MKNKVILFDKIQEFIKKKRGREKTVILCHGCFDIVHPGHIRHLKFAKELGDILVVSITPDVCILKASSRPFVPQDLRAENLAALEIVDAVTIAPADTAIEPIKKIRPDIYVKGSEYAISRDPRFLEEKKLVEKAGGKLAYSSGDVVFSSTELIRDYDLRGTENEKLKYICERYGVNCEILDRILKEASNKSVLLIGEAVLDEYKYCEGVGIAQESPVLSISLKHSNSFLRSCGSLAQHFSALGSEVTLISSIDMKSPQIDFFRDNLNNYNISFINIEDSQRPLVVKSHYFVEKNQVLEVENGHYRPLDSILRRKIMRRFKKEIKDQPDCVIFTDAGYGMLAEDLVVDMINLAREKQILTIAEVSLALRARLDKFYEADILVATELELRSCLHDYESGLSVLVDKLYTKSGIKELYLMLSDGDSLFFRRSSEPGVHNMESAHIPNLFSKNEDKQGRGEAFLAGIALARIYGANEVQSIYLGAVFSAIHSRKIGNHPLSIEEIHCLLGERKELNKNH